MNQITSQQHQHRDLWKECVTIGTINRLFIKFTARYNARFTSQFDDDVLLGLAKNEWYEELKHLTNADIKSGIDSWKGSWPPNIVEFKHECRPAPCYREYDTKALPPPIHKDIGNTALSSIRDMLK